MARAWLRQYCDLTSVQLRTMRVEVWFVITFQGAMTTGLVLGMGFIMPDISDTTARYIVIGTAAQSFATIGLVMLPQLVARSRDRGMFEYYLTLPISREAYILAVVTAAAVLAFPAVVFSTVFGAWHFGIALQFDPAVFAVALLAVLSVAGAGVAMAVYSPHQQVTNALTQVAIFYIIFFAPVLMPKEQLPAGLQFTAHFFPPTYAADGLRATLTDLPGTHLARSLMAMTAFGAGSLVLSAVAMRRRG